jgi:peptidoglycan/xylan/chitin deacetylase (PgdA/CDA1 family)
MLLSKLKNWVNLENQKKLDKEPFSSLPLRMRIGIFLLALSFSVGYGVSFFVLVFSGFKHKLSIGLLRSSIFYIASWPIGLIGLALAGVDSIKYPIYFAAKFLKKLFPNYFKEGNDSIINNKYTRISQFHLIMILSLIGIVISIALAFIFSSYSLLIFGIIFIFCFQQTFYIHGMFSASSNFFFKTVKGREYFDNKKGILFRFDDGPHPVYTIQILDILKSEGISALFAVTGKNAEMYPEIVEIMHREGHIIANHTYSHPYNILLLGYKRVRNEIARTNIIIQNITGEQPKYFCPTIGHKNQVIGKVIKELDLIPLMWDIQTVDTHASLEKIMKIIKKKLKSPAIILFHDAITPWSKNDRESTVLALKETIRILKEQNYL